MKKLILISVLAIGLFTLFSATCNADYRDGYYFDDFYSLKYGQLPTGNFYFVAINGSDDTGNGSITNPWRTPQKGATELYPGDVLFIRAGTYDAIWNQGQAGASNAVIHPVRDGNADNPIVIRSYPGESVLIYGGPPGQNTNATIGTTYYTDTEMHYDYLVIDGLNIRGLVSLWHTKGSAAINCDIYGGGERQNGFGCVIWLSDSEDTVIRNNRLHDNESHYGQGSGNTPLIMAYLSHDCIIEHNEIYNSVDAGINLKDKPVDIHVRYNIFHDCAGAGVWSAQQNGDSNTSYIYQNIFKNNSRGVEPIDFNQLISVYNNLFIDNTNCIFDEEADQHRCHYSSWNNIFVNPTQCFYLIDYGSLPSGLSYSDYNDFYDTSNPRWQIEGAAYTSLAQWQNNSVHDDHSISANPMFVNQTGGDYHLQPGSPCIGAGQNGQNMGPYITGNEIIGPITNEETPAGTYSGELLSDFQNNYSNQLTITKGTPIILRYRYANSTDPLSVRLSLEIANVLNPEGILATKERFKDLTATENIAGGRLTLATTNVAVGTYLFKVNAQRVTPAGYLPIEDVEPIWLTVTIE